MTIRRRHPHSEGLTTDELHVLRWGTTLGLSPSRFTRIGPDGRLVIDRAAARAAWPAYRGQLMAECAREAAEGWPALVPWGSHEFDGLVGQVGPYDHLRYAVQDDGPDAA